MNVLMNVCPGLARPKHPGDAAFPEGASPA